MILLAQSNKKRLKTDTKGAVWKITPVYPFETSGVGAKSPSCAYQECLGRYTGKGSPKKGDSSGCNWAAYYDIELSESLSAGEYDAALLVQCYQQSGEALNSARIEFDLTVMEVK